MTRYKNKRKKKHIPLIESNLRNELSAEFSTMACRCKFNFSYLDTSQANVVDFDYFSHENLKKLITKIKNFTKKSLEDWKRERTYISYGAFPSKTKLEHPSFVPNEVQWGRFRLQGTFRLAGFTVSDSIAKNLINLDTNTFYVVFLDIDHNFFLSPKKHT